MKKNCRALRLFSFLLLYLVVANSYSAIYYVDDINGNDSNNGLTIATAWQTIYKVSTSNFLPGDTIKFKRGGVFRGQLLPKNGDAISHVVYSAYGNGAKPRLLGSENRSSTSDWIDEGGNIWRSVSSFPVDVGNLIFNNATEFGIKKWNQASLVSQGDYWHDRLGTQAVKIYSTSNPGSYYADIEMALGNHMIYCQLNSYISFENLWLEYGGANGFEIRNTHHIVIKDCDFSYIGGSELAGQVRYGNAIQFWASSNNNIVKRNKIWEIYDTGVSNQNNNSGGAAQVYNLYYTNNIIWNCAYAGFEVWLDAFGPASLMKNIYFDNNTCVNIGGGWANAQRPDHFLQSGAGSAIYLGHTTAITDSIFIRNNVFYKAACILFANNEGIETLLETEMDFNIWYKENPTDTIAVFYTSSNIDLWTNAQFSNFQSVNNSDINSLAVDPLMADPNGWNFQLTAGSPCIDAGTNTGIAYDFDLTPTPQNLVYDIGAYEYIPGMQVVDPESASDILLYPNPTSGIFQVRTNEAFINALISIYDITGKAVQNTLITGPYTQVNVTELPNGIYFVEIKQNDTKIYSSKIVLQK